MINHQTVSFAKSGLRIAACLSVMMGAGLFIFALLFLIAELVGIAEELV